MVVEEFHDQKIIYHLNIDEEVNNILMHLSSLKTIKTNRVIKGTTLVGAFYIFSLAFYSYLFHILFAWIFLLLSIGFAAIGLSVEKLQKVFMRAIINKEKQKMNNERKYVFSKEGVDIVTQAGATHNYWSYIAGWSSSREMKEMKASMDVIRKTAGEMIDQLTEELEIILEEKQKTELHEKYGILVDALEAAGYRYDYRESEPGHIVLAPDGTHEIAGYLQFESWGDIKDWLEDTIAEGTDISERVDRALYPFKFDYTLEEEMFRGNGDRYAIYHVDEDTPGKQHLFMNMAMVKEDGITIDAANYKCVYSGRLHENEKLDDLYAVFNDNPPADYKAHSMSVSDVIITNRGGDMQAYYVDRFGFAELPDFAAQREKILDIVPEIENVDYENDLTCISFYAAECAEFPVMGEVHYQIDGKKGNWIATDTIIIDGKQFYLMEHQVYRDQAQGVILDAYGKMVVEECKKFDEKTKQKIHDYIQQQVPLNPVEQLKQDGKIRLEHYQKFYQNGTYERSRESGTEANYDMVDGLVNNQKKNQEKTSDASSNNQTSRNQQDGKSKKRRSVIKRLHQKQIAIARRSGKPIPKYLDQEMERKRG